MRRTGLGKARFAVFRHPWDGIARQGETQGPAKAAGPKAAPRRKQRSGGRPAGGERGRRGGGGKEARKEPGRNATRRHRRAWTARTAGRTRPGRRRGAHTQRRWAGGTPTSKARRPRRTTADVRGAERSGAQRLEAAAPQRGTPVTRTFRGWAEPEDAQSARNGGAARGPAGRFPGTQHLCVKTGFCVHFTKMRIA